jgi:hypothetical protein
MGYHDHFALVDDVSAHFDEAVGAVTPMLASRYTGLYAVSSAAVLELAFKSIIVDFATRMNPVFGDYVSSRYEQVNGRIKVRAICDEHLKPFGEGYKIRFERLLKRIDASSVARRQGSLISAYGNLLTCRHMFAHEGVIPANSTYDEVKKGYSAGKLVMACLSKALE